MIRMEEKLNNVSKYWAAEKDYIQEGTTKKELHIGNNIYT